MPIAPLVAAYGRQFPSSVAGPWPGPGGVSDGGSTPLTFPTTPMAIKVEFYLGTQWVDVTDYVLWKPQIKITRGRKDVKTKGVPSTCALTLKNNDRRFSTRYVNGPYYGLLTKATRMRVWINPGIGWRLRGTWTISEWPPTWSTGNDRVVSIVGRGRLYSLGLGDEPLRSPMERSIVAASPVTYHPGEDGSNATSIASGLVDAGSTVLSLAGSINFSSNSSIPGSKSLPTFSGSTSINTTFTHTFASHWQMDWWAEIPAAPAAEVHLMRVFVRGGNVDYWHIALGPTYWSVRAIKVDGSVLVDSGAAPLTQFFLGEPIHLRLMVRDEGGGTLRWAGEVNRLDTSGFVLSGTYSDTFGNPYSWVQPNYTDLDGSMFGHWAMYDAYDFSATDSSANGYDGELATDRFDRLLTEEGIPHVVTETSVETETMGPQGTDTLINLLRDCAEVNEGVLDEDLDDNLRLLSRSIRYGAMPVVRLNYAAGEVSPDLQPVDDDTFIRNKWTISRTNGSKAIYEVTTGPLSTADSPAGIGPHPDSATLNLSTDTQAYAHAAFRASRDTVDELRYKVLPFQLDRDPEYVDNWTRYDVVSARLVVTNAPADVGGDDIDQIIEGYQERITDLSYKVDAYTSTAAPYRVGTVEDAAFRLDCAGSTLSAAVDETATSLTLTIVDNCVWDHGDGDFAVSVAGEDMLVTAAGAATGTYPLQAQTLTVVRSINGVVKRHAVGEPVVVRDPFVIAL